MKYLFWFLSFLICSSANASDEDVFKKFFGANAALIEGVYNGGKRCALQVRSGTDDYWGEKRPYSGIYIFIDEIEPTVDSAYYFGLWTDNYGDETLSDRLKRQNWAADISKNILINEDPNVPEGDLKKLVINYEKNTMLVTGFSAVFKSSHTINCSL